MIRSISFGGTMDIEGLDQPISLAYLSHILNKVVPAITEHEEYDPEFPVIDTTDHKEEEEYDPAAPEIKTVKNEKSELVSIFMCNVSFSASEADLYHYVKNVAQVPVHTAKICEKTEGQKVRKRWAFVSLFNVDDAKKAVDLLNQQLFMGRRMGVSVSNKN